VLILKNILAIPFNFFKGKKPKKRLIIGRLKCFTAIICLVLSFLTFFKLNRIISWLGKSSQIGKTIGLILFDQGKMLERNSISFSKWKKIKKNFYLGKDYLDERQVSFRRHFWGTRQYS
jgi:hypothetical protein